MTNMTQIEVNAEIVEELREILNELETVYREHHIRGCWDTEVLIETWSPSNSEIEGPIDLPNFTVGFAKRAVDLKKRLRL